jgi:hypothetical protein
MVLVVPVYRLLMAGWGATLGLPARLAVDVSRFGAVLMLAWAVAAALAWWKDRAAPGGRLTALFAVSALVFAVYLALVTSVYLDAARAMPGHAIVPR